jgi:hypothetical protein
MVLWVSGVVPPQLIPEHLVFAKQRRLELVRAFQLIADRKEQASDQFNWKLGS